ncbi:unnamed protein product [Paramecium primaurelia]|uniref:Uncharacterized protein n=1 Tax=Paramecium primaurelia TaxID=5886 RepID=A0A8S1PBJ1_PARPR|nr:unnamed protein product [Paramecium primaurelia]
MIRVFLRDNTESCLDLIDKGDNLDEIDKKSGKSLLQIALTNNNLQLVKALLAKKVDVNFLNKIDRSTSLFTSIQSNFIKGAQALVQDLEVEIEGRSYLEHAFVIGTVQIIQLLMSNQKLITFGNKCRKQDETHNFQFKMKFDQQIKMKIREYFIYQHLMVLQNCLMQQLKTYKQAIQNKEENTSLHIAAINDKQLFLKVLLSNKDNVNLDVNKLNRAGLNYQQIIEDRKKKVELEQQEQQVRKRLIAEDRKDNNKGLKKQKLDNRRKRIKVKIKRSRSQQRDIIEEGRYKNRFVMLDIFAIVILGFYIVLQFSIKKK